MSLLAAIVRDLQEFDWRELAAPQGAGAWPAPVKTGIVLLLTASLLAGGYLLRLREQQERDSRLGVEQEELTAELERLKRSVANLDGYRQQAREIEEPYMRILRQLPYQSEIPALIDEVTALGLDFGMRFVSIGLAAERDRPHYVEQPIDIRVSGGYHEIGAFFSGVAALDRIVTIHDFSLQGSTTGKLELELRARTYRYRPLSGSVLSVDFASPEEDPDYLAERGSAEPFTYSAFANRDPFAPLAEPADSGPEAARSGRNPLEKLSLNELRLVGLLKDGQRYIGLLRDPSGAVHRVERGDDLGPDRARVRQITDQGVELSEWKTDESGVSVQRQILLRWEEDL